MCVHFQTPFGVRTSGNLSYYRSLRTTKKPDRQQLKVAVCRARRLAERVRLRRARTKRALASIRCTAVVVKASSDAVFRFRGVRLNRKMRYAEDIQLLRIISRLYRPRLCKTYISCRIGSRFERVRGAEKAQPLCPHPCPSDACRSAGISGFCVCTATPDTRAETLFRASVQVLHRE